MYDALVQWNGESFRADGLSNVAIPCESTQEAFYVCEHTHTYFSTTPPLPKFRSRPRNAPSYYSSTLRWLLFVGTSFWYFCRLATKCKFCTRKLLARPFTISVQITNYAKYALNQNTEKCIVPNNCHPKVNFLNNPLDSIHVTSCMSIVFILIFTMHTHSHSHTAFVQLSVASPHLATCATVYLSRVPTRGSPSLHILVPGAEYVCVLGLQLFCTLQVTTQQTLAQTYNLAHILKYWNNFSYNWRDSCMIGWENICTDISLRLHRIWYNM